jgi:hypothetical protein
MLRCGIGACPAGMSRYLLKRAVAVAM